MTITDKLKKINNLQQKLTKLFPAKHWDADFFMNLILLKNDFPPLFISTVDKLAYMNCFEQEDKNPGVMLDFLADRLMESLKTKLSFLKEHQNKL